jgi:hypothetical protein
MNFSNNIFLGCFLFIPALPWEVESRKNSFSLQVSRKLSFLSMHIIVTASISFLGSLFGVHTAKESNLMLMKL